MAIKGDYIERVYAGLLGKCIGVRLGAHLESAAWTYERILATYGDIRGYVKDYRNFAADDDINGPVFFIRALVDYGRKRRITAEDVGRTWLNYTRDGRGFFWWGGYGRSTEHTAYLNLKNGIPAPMSGSARRNGLTVAEQIGGQIFSDAWGLVLPGKPEEAARYGAMAASVSHDGNGIYGGQFIAAAIASAFSGGSVGDVIGAALRVIPEECKYSRVVRAVTKYHEKNHADFRACRDYLERNFGYDRYPGACHIIPNAGVCVLALLYGEGNLSRTVEIATMCGWDTDCNAGNVGTIVGVLAGLDGIDESYRGPINDSHVASSVAGSLNILDLPRVAREIASLGYDLAGQKAPSEVARFLFSDTLAFDFDLPGSTHGWRTDSNRLTLKNKQQTVAAGQGGVLEILVESLEPGKSGKIFYKPFYRREDFSDERYSPAFAPQVYPGQRLGMKILGKMWSGRVVGIAPYVRTTEDREITTGAFAYLPAEEGREESLKGCVKVKGCVEGCVKENPENRTGGNEEQWTELDWEITDVGFRTIDEIGLLVENFGSERYLGSIYLDDIIIGGPGRQRINFGKQVSEFQTFTPGIVDRGAWEITGQYVELMSIDGAEFYTGPYYTRDFRLKLALEPQYGDGHMAVFRAKGAAVGYLAGLTRRGGKPYAVLYRKEYGLTLLEETAYEWREGGSYRLEVEVTGACLTLKINDQEVLACTDPDPIEYGMYGFGLLGAGRLRVASLECDFY